MHEQAITEAARAKINLALSVVGQRPDGYHRMESVVAFAQLCDRVTAMPAGSDVFALSGRFGAGLISEAGDNLVIRARDGLRALLLAKGRPAPPVSLHLEKNLPIASGIGGGSADAAACIRALMRLWRVENPVAGLDALLLTLGADVPMCFASRPLLAEGIGEKITPLANLPVLPMVLVNPLLPVSTPDIFRRLTVKTNPPLPRPLPADDGWLAWLAATRNDLENPARALVSEIGDALGLLAALGARFARMSGSGATAFGVFDDTHSAGHACAAIRAEKPDWFVEATATRAGDH